jgi:hypothetical protein
VRSDGLQEEDETLKLKVDDLESNWKEHRGIASRRAPTLRCSGSGEEASGSQSRMMMSFFVLAETKVGAELHIPLGRYVPKNQCHLQDCRHVCAVGWDPPKIESLLIKESLLAPALPACADTGGRLRSQAANCGHRPPTAVTGRQLRSQAANCGHRPPTAVTGRQLRSQGNLDDDR